VKRLLPRSLIGQIALVMAAALLVAQTINFALVRSERQRLTQTQLEAPVMARFVNAVSRMVENERERPIENRRGRIAFGTASSIQPDAVDIDLAQRLQETAAASGIVLTEARASSSDELPPPPARAEGRLRTPEAMERRAERFRSLLLSVRLPDGRWVNGQLLVLRPSPWPLVQLAAATALIYFALLGAVLLVASRLVRPLRDLTRAAQRFRGRGETLDVEPRGPTDVRRAIEAFNAMGSRVGGLLDEKDRMLGAIGHDLRTPLASLRIRAENMEPAEERERMIATIEEMTALLDDTLALARSGRSKEPPRPLDVAALTDAVVEEFRELGHDVALEDCERSVACVRPNLLRGAIRNLIDNAVKYAGAARLAVSSDGERVSIEVMDRGPGIPEAQLELVQEAFVRLESSRSRQTGGTGLGITLARAAAQLHDGKLELENRPGGGLVVRMLLPCAERRI
jgi:signal transduction histidine kinase